MFGIGKSKSEKLALRLERYMMSMEMAADKGRWDAAVYASRQMLPLLREIHLQNEWTDGALEEFLRKRGLVRQLVDEDYSDWLRENMPPH